ncbi:hypothetical protein GCM10027157_16850 [Corynebacterium aquatimens]
MKRVKRLSIAGLAAVAVAVGVPSVANADTTMGPYRNEFTCMLRYAHPTTQAMVTKPCYKGADGKWYFKHRY